MSQVAPICLSCAHLDPSLVGRMKCAAFPDEPGIPDPIVDNELDHRLPVDGDNGIVFEQDPEQDPPELAFAILDDRAGGHEPLPSQT